MLLVTGVKGAGAWRSFPGSEKLCHRSDTFHFSSLLSGQTLSNLNRALKCSSTVDLTNNMCQSLQTLLCSFEGCQLLFYRQLIQKTQTPSCVSLWQTVTNLVSSHILPSSSCFPSSGLFGDFATCNSQQSAKGKFIEGFQFTASFPEILHQFLTSLSPKQVYSRLSFSLGHTLNSKAKVLNSLTSPNMLPLHWQTDLQDLLVLNFLSCHPRILTNNLTANCVFKFSFPSSILSFSQTEMCHRTCLFLLLPLLSFRMSIVILPNAYAVRDLQSPALVFVVHRASSESPLSFLP